jgi:hypothetical protein
MWLQAATSDDSGCERTMSALREGSLHLVIKTRMYTPCYQLSLTKLWVINCHGDTHTHTFFVVTTSTVSQTWRTESWSFWNLNILTKTSTPCINLNIDGLTYSFKITHSPLTLSNFSPKFSSRHNNRVTKRWRKTGQVIRKWPRHRGLQV